MSSNPADRSLPRPATQGETQLLTAFESAAAEVLSSANATTKVELGDPCGSAMLVARLEPTRVDAAPLAMQIDTEEQVTFYVGRNGVPIEVHLSDREELRRVVHDWTEAVINGGYSEEVLAGPRGAAKAVAELNVRGKVQRITYNVLFHWPKRARASWEHVEYAPYR